VGRGTDPVSGTVDRVAAARVDLWDAGHLLSAREARSLGEQGAGSSSVRYTACVHHAPTGTARCSQLPHVPPPLSCPRHVLLRRRGGRAVHLRDLERVPCPAAHAPHAHLPEPAARARRPHPAPPVRPARGHPSGRRADAGDRATGERAYTGSDRANGGHDRHLPCLYSAVRAGVPRAARAARRRDGAREPRPLHR